MSKSDPLGGQAADFAERIELTVRGVLPGQPRIASLRIGDRVVITAVDANNERARVPLYAAGEHVADLSLSLFQSMDRTGQYLKTERSDFVAYSVLDRQPLVRLDYRHDMSAAPISHWQIHAERGALSSLLTKAVHAVHAVIAGEHFHGASGGLRCIRQFFRRQRRREREQRLVHDGT